MEMLEIIIGIASLFLVCSPILRSYVGIQYFIRFISSVLIVVCGSNFLEKMFEISWFLSLFVSVAYLLAIYLIESFLESKLRNKTI